MMSSDTLNSLAMYIVIAAIIIMLYYSINRASAQLSKTKTNIVDITNKMDIPVDNVVADKKMNAKIMKHLSMGIYGDVPVYLYRNGDNETAPNWREIDQGIYLPNSKTYWMDT